MSQQIKLAVITRHQTTVPPLRLGHIVWVVNEDGIYMALPLAIPLCSIGPFVRITELDFLEVTLDQAYHIPLIIERQGQPLSITPEIPYKPNTPHPILIQFKHILIGIETDGYAHS